MRIRIVAPDGTDIVDSATHSLPVSVVSSSGGGLTDAELRATPVAVDGSGVTQPVSGTVTVGNASIAVTGTFWQATQPISVASLPLPSGASTETTLSTLSSKVTACNTGAVTVSAITPPTLTKGTQGSTGFSTQDLKDSGRVAQCFSCTAVATVTSEAMVTLTRITDGAANGTGTSFVVTAGKRLRIQALIVTIRCTSTVNNGGIVRLRMNAGSVTTSSQVVLAVGGQGSNLATAVAGNCQTYMVDLPDGFEISGSIQLGLSQLFSATSSTIDACLVGFEY